VIQRLKPSFKDLPECDIIDINPGASIWSSKIHDVLKPRRHILIEHSGKSLYKPLIQPLLDQDTSKYHLVEGQPLHFSTYSRLFDDGLLPEQTSQLPGVDAQKENRSLLLLANLGYRAKIPHLFNGPLALYLLHIFCMSMYTRAYFHKYGWVRMLVWVPAKDKHSFLPRSVAERSPGNLKEEAACFVTEVAGPHSNGSARDSGQDLALEIERMERVSQKMLELGITVPKGRRRIRPEPHPASVRADTDGFARLRKQQDRTPHQNEVLELLDAIERRKRSGKAVQENADRRRTSAEEKRLSHLTGQMRRDNDAYVALQNLLARQAALDNMEKSINEEDLTSRRELKEDCDEFDREIATGFNPQQSTVLKTIDDRRAFYQSPCVLAWDRREVEPLTVKDNEFHPQEAMVLLDIRPNLDVIDTINTEEKLLCYEYVCVSLFEKSTTSVWDALDTLTRGNAEAIIRTVPALHDTTKGGSFDLRRVRVRTLPVATVVELALAWVKWPFRPTLSEMGSQLRKQHSGAIAEA